MIEELNLDKSNNKIYMSKRLSLTGRQDYEPLLRSAIEGHNDGWLADRLREKGRLNATEEKRKPSGGTTVAKVPIDAPDMLAEGEFNRFYARGLCLRAIAEGVQKLMIYRAKEVRSPRTESQQMIGREVDPKILLEDLRANIGIEPALKLPPGPNSGLSVKLP